ncbi:MAG: pyrroline-5-carboxylate reductase [Phycisphaerales bacterium]|jgi:pyrroline-5-carboxylate reductase|nr:pyrroline-5-carboxylate reductase [Phycisphaerales bacterium]
MTSSTINPNIQLAVLGLGNMGAAVLQGGLDGGILTPNAVLICDPDPTRLSPFVDLGCRVGTPEDAASTPRVLLAVKPQIFPELTPAFSDRPRNRTVISVMAGIRGHRIAAAMGPGTAVIRAMPNMPASIGHGVTAIAASSDVPEAEQAFARELFAAVGTVVEVEEELMFAVTATSGSGPAWVYRLVEAWIKAAEDQGLPPETARSLVHGTLLGAARLLDRSDLSAGELRAAVTSKGGTTAAGQEALDAHGFDLAIAEAIAAATRRGRELDEGT